MKKFLALILVIALSTVIFAACNKPEETTAGNDDTSATVNTNGSSATETSTTAETTRSFVDQQVVDSLNYDFYARYIVDDQGKKIGVAVYSWKQDKLDSSIVIPSEYTDEKGDTYPVLKVGVTQSILTLRGQLETVTIPGSVKEINRIAFSMCTSLKTLNLSEGLEKIGEMAFWNCKSLQTLVIPSTVVEIGEGAFDDCTALTSVTLPRRFESQVDTIFSGCPNVSFTFVD